MPFNGSGTYTLPVNSFNPAVPATALNSSDWNVTGPDIATGLTATITRDGQSTTTARIPFALGAQTDSITELTAANGVTIGKVNNAIGADVASAGTINLTTATGQTVDVTGTTTITAITLGDGSQRWVRFTGILTLTHGANLVLPGAANITTAVGDYALFIGYAAGVVRCAEYQVAAGAPITSYTGTGPVVRQTSPTLITPTLGAALATSINGMTTPATSGALGYLNIPSNPQATAYTTVLADAGKAIDHLSTDANARTFTIDDTLAYPDGTAITFTNMTSQVVTIACTTAGNLYLGGVGTTGNRSLARYGQATARKQTTGVWIISGAGLT